MRFLDGEGRTAISRAILVGVGVVILVAALGGFFLLSQGPTSETSIRSSAASSTNVVSSTTTTTSPASTTASSTATTSTTSSSSISTSAASTSQSATTSSSTATSSSSPPQNFDFTLASAPGTMLLSPGSSLFYPSLSIVPATTSATTGESVTLNSSLPTGFTLSFDSNPAKVNPGTPRTVQMTFNVAQSVSPGDYNITVGGKSGAFSKATTFTVHVVQYLVLMQSNTFVSDSLTVKAGSTVYWINLDAPAGGDPEMHNVAFTSGTNAVSPSMSQYATYSYTFSTAGVYKYYCTYHPASMQATITVTSG